MLSYGTTPPLTRTETALSPVTTRLGPIEGTTTHGVQVFRGIPYAAPPLGELRFHAPTPAPAWSGTFDATGWGPRSLQADSPLSAGAQGELSEDCLILNIYTPAAGDGSGGPGSRPVLVWIHGGAFLMGSANEYDGSVLAAQGDVVVVTVNYRLGLFGFLDLSRFAETYAGSASNGFRDQIAALGWVRDNIADFGGDPGNVTILGESAGGGSVNALLSAPSADGLYHRAIAHSGGTPSTPPADFTKPLADALGVEVDDLLTTLQGMPATEILALQNRTGISGSGSSVDGIVVTRPTHVAMAERGDACVPYIAGSNRDEGTLFTSMSGDDADFSQILATVGMNLARSTMLGSDPSGYVGALRQAHPDLDDRALYERIWVDMFRRASIDNAQAATAAGPGGWLYRFDLPATAMGGNLGAAHAAEIAFTFNSFELPATTLSFHDGSDPVVRDLARKWSDTVLAFARTGDPNGAGLPHWPRYSTTDRRSIVLDAESRIEDATLDAEARAIWNDASV